MSAANPKPLKLTRPEPTEAAVLLSVRRALSLHPKVAWFERMNSAAGRLLYPDGRASQFMRFGFVGMPDILGQLKDGRLLAIEVKRPSGNVSPEQADFIEMSARHHAVAFVARRVSDVLDVLEKV
jgi:hypothetical protein